MESPSVILQSTSFKLAPGSAPISSPPGLSKSSQVKSTSQIESDCTTPSTRGSGSPTYLEVPTSREDIDRLYEARAPPPLALPPPFLSLCPAQSTCEDSESDSVDTLFLYSSPLATPLRFSPSPVFDSGFDPISNAPAIILRPASATRADPETKPPERFVQNKITRRYLSPAYIRGESLPFSIAEENETETSGSQYSTESALELSEGPPDTETSGESGPSRLEEMLDSSSNPRNATPAKLEAEESARRFAIPPRTLSILKQISPKKSMRSMVDNCRKLSIRGRLRLLQL